MEHPVDPAAAKRERIKAISRTIHSIPVAEGGQLRPPRPEPAPPPPPTGWKRHALALGGVGGLAFGLLAGLAVTRRTEG